MSMEITKKNIPLATIYRPLNNIFLNPFMEYLRKKYICKNQIKKGIKGVKKTIEYINNNNSIALMIDQRVSEGEKINFFKNLHLRLLYQHNYRVNLKWILFLYLLREIRIIVSILSFKKELILQNFKNKLELSEELNKVLRKMMIKKSHINGFGHIIGGNRILFF